MILEGTITSIENAHENQKFEKYILIQDGPNEIGIQVRRRTARELPELTVGDHIRAEVKCNHQSHYNMKKGFYYHHNNIILEHLI